MKTVFLALAATIIGGAVGLTMTYRELTSIGNVGLGSPVDAIELGNTGPVLANTGIPRLRLMGEKEHNFGAMETGTTKSHVFVIKNEGRGPLTLEKGDTSCKCTISDLTDNSLAPGESTEIKLEWTPKAYEPLFQQTAEIRTNDPSTPVLVLTVTGRVIQSVRSDPESIAMGSIPLNKPSITELKLYSYAERPVAITEIEWANDGVAEFFSAEILEMPTEDLQADSDAKSGKIVKIRIESGLPLGPINQRIRLTTNLPEFPVLEVPLAMTVTGDISIVGRGYTDEKATLMLGRIRSQAGYVAKLNILVKGEHREGIEIDVGEVKPDDVLKASLGEAKSVKNGEILMIPLEITIPKGSRSASYISSNRDDQGLVLLKTNHPDAKQLSIYVRFAIE